MVEAERAEAAGVVDVNVESGGDSDDGGTANGDVEARCAGGGDSDAESVRVLEHEGERR